MADFLSMYSIQHWLESCPQGYLGGTEFGHLPSEKEPELLVADATIREQAIGVTVQLVVGERCALAASSGLINAAPDEASKRYLATQTLDEARHVEVFTQRLYDLGVKKTELEDVIRQQANPNLVKFAEILLEKVDKKDFVAGVVGQNIVLEGMAFTVFEMLHAGNEGVNPKFAHTLSGTIADERRHVGFGENRIGSLIRENPERKPEIERMQRDMSYWMLATFADMQMAVVTHYQWPDIAGHMFPTISMTTDFVARAPMGAWVEGTADVIRATKTLVFMQGTATAEGETILRFSGIYKIGPKRDYANPRDPFGLLSDPHARKK